MIRTTIVRLDGGPLPTTLTTAEAAHLVGISSKSFAKWARMRGIIPIRKDRRALWKLKDLLAAHDPPKTVLDKGDL